MCDFFSGDQRQLERLYLAALTGEAGPHKADLVHNLCSAVSGGRGSQGARPVMLFAHLHS